MGKTKGSSSSRKSQRHQNHHDDPVDGDEPHHSPIHMSRTMTGGSSRPESPLSGIEMSRTSSLASFSSRGSGGSGKAPFEIPIDMSRTSSQASSLRAGAGTETYSLDEDDNGTGGSGVDVLKQYYEAVDLLSEKRKSTRISALRLVCTLLATNYIQKDEGESTHDSLMTALRQSLRRRSGDEHDDEMVLVCRALAILWIQVGPHSHDYKTMSSLLQQYISQSLSTASNAKSASTSSIKKSASLEALSPFANAVSSAIEALTIIALVEDVGNAELLALTSKLESLIVLKSPLSKLKINLEGTLEDSSSTTKTSSELAPNEDDDDDDYSENEDDEWVFLENADVLLPTLNAMGILYSMLTPDMLSRIGSRLLETHHSMLEHFTNVELRVAIGENIALFAELLNGEDTEEVGENDDFREQLGQAWLEYERLDELIELIESLSQESHKYKSKKDRSSQKSAFREILGTVKSGETPSLKLKFKNEVLELDSWSLIKKLHAIRRAIGEGMSSHFYHNPVVQYLFSFEPDYEAEEEALSQIEKRLNQTFIGKARSKEMRASRTSKHSSRRGDDGY